MIKNKKTIFIAFIVLLIIILMSMPFIKRYQMRAENDDAIKEFNSLTLFTPANNVDNRIINGGDGIDSKPYLQVEREFVIKAKGGEVETQLIKNLDMQSVKIVEKKYTQRCNEGEVEALYRLVDVHGREITVNTGSTIDSLSSGCRYESISPESFYGQEVTYLFARTYMH